MCKVVSKPISCNGGDRINLSVFSVLQWIAAFTFGAVHTAIPLKNLVIKRIYELFYSIELFCRIMLTQIILLTQFPSFLSCDFQPIEKPACCDELSGYQE